MKLDSVIRINVCQFLMKFWMHERDVRKGRYKLMDMTN